MSRKPAVIDVRAALGIAGELDGQRECTGRIQADVVLSDDASLHGGDAVGGARSVVLRAPVLERGHPGGSFVRIARSVKERRVGTESCGLDREGERLACWRVGNEDGLGTRQRLADRLRTDVRHAVVRLNRVKTVGQLTQADGRFDVARKLDGGRARVTGERDAIGQVDRVAVAVVVVGRQTGFLGLWMNGAVVVVTVARQACRACDERDPDVTEAVVVVVAVVIHRAIAVVVHTVAGFVPA